MNKILGMKGEQILTLASVGNRNHIYIEQKNKMVCTADGIPGLIYELLL